MRFFFSSILFFLFILFMHQGHAQQAFQKINHALITHLNEQVVFQPEEINNGIAGEMLLILTIDSGKVNDVILKKGLTTSLNREISRACLDFTFPDVSVGHRFTIMLFVDSRLKRISPLL
jgi:hypothetical protein